jgi:uncharacterized DUF497 family protein
VSARQSSNPLESCTGFDWDEWNTIKNWDRHRVTPEEAEDVFFHEPMVLRSEPGISRREKRYRAMGQTSRGRRLLVIFTVRRNLIRVISVRDLNGKENEEYTRYEEKNP